MSSLIVVDTAADWDLEIPGTRVISANAYLTGELNLPRATRVFNLCRSYRYQSSGYYVSLLAAARGHRPLPDITTIQDLKSTSMPRLLSEDLQDLIDHSLRRLQSPEFELSIYFGTNIAARHARLSRAVFNLFPAPLLRARFHRVRNQWRLKNLHVIALDAVPDGHRNFLEQAARDWFGRRRQPVRGASQIGFDLAILHNPDEAQPPSNGAALKLIEKAAREQGFSVDFLQRDDFGRVAEYDALFIRETTRVNHHTYRFARRAESEGLVVIDDPLSIVRCTNKVFLAEVLKRQRIPTPPTLVVHRGNAANVAAELGFPVVLKQPDSAFSQGVVKAEDAAALKHELQRLFAVSELVVAQAFVPTEFDWRVGVLDGKALFVCRYFMAASHWQIINHGAAGADKEGDAETLPVEDAPPAVIKLAERACRAFGNSLYGVDIKQRGRSLYVIEVNDNPNLDAGIEDEALGFELYQRLIGVFRQRVEQRKLGKVAHDH